MVSRDGRPDFPTPSKPLQFEKGTRVLSETRSLPLCGVLRGGLELKLRLARRSRTGPSKLLETLPRTRRLGMRTTAQPGRPRGAPAIDPRRLGCLDDQFLGVVARSPFFQSVQVMVASLRARVKRASSGFIPWATRAVKNSRQGPGRRLTHRAALLKTSFRSWL